MNDVDFNKTYIVATQLPYGRELTYISLTSKPEKRIVIVGPYSESCVVQSSL